MGAIEQIFVVGFNHKLTNNNTRGDLLRHAPKELSPSILDSYNLKAINILQTCNRWELYGYGSSKGAQQLLQDLTKQSLNEVHLICLTGMDALHHIFRVAAGLDSMVLGDQEILSQFKKSFVQSKKQNILNSFMERLANTSLKAAKHVRKHTEISEGTTSLSYAVVHILKKVNLQENKKILLLGLGKFGLSILKNIKEYFPEIEVYLSNRTNKKSETLSLQYSCNSINWEDCPNRIWQFPLVISSLHSDKILFEKIDCESNTKHIIDLSMPSPFSHEIKSANFIDYYSIDDAAKVVNKSLENRQKSIQPAHDIIDEHIQEFISWASTYSHSDILKEWKHKLTEASSICPFFQSLDKEESIYYIQKSMGHFAKHVKRNKENKNSDEVLSSYLNSQHQ